MTNQVPLSELTSRLQRFKKRMNSDYSDWEIAVIFSKINLLYLTGSMPDGMLIIPRESDPVFWVRRSYERTLDESLFPDIRPMGSFKDAAAYFQKIPDTIYLETEFIPLAMYQRFHKYFPFSDFKPLDYQIAMTRAIKSPYELNYMEDAGRVHQRILDKRVPQMLKEGMNEVEFAATLYHAMLDEGHMGNARFNMFDTEMVIGQIGFGESSIYPTSFNGPGGNSGMSPAVPIIGNRERKLNRGDLVFVDIGVGVNGYHTDRTSTYMFKNKLPIEALKAHEECVELQFKIAGLLKPGNIPSEIYESIVNQLSPEFSENFMGYGKRQVKFLGHAIGLTIDEFPVLAKGFDEPLEENMVFAVEPKKGIKGVGMVGIENTFVVTSDGGRCITGDSRGMTLVE